jgi:hypothetical protein
MLNQELLQESAEALAAVLAHELTHADQVASGYGGRWDCVKMEVEAYISQIEVWESFWGGEGPSTTALERDHNALLRRYLSGGEPAIYKRVVDTVGYQDQCRLWVPG